jgi:hypothetical protein
MQATTSPIEFAPGTTARTVPILLVSRRDAARMLGIGVSKFYEVTRAGGLHPVRLFPTATPLYRVDEIQELIERKTQRS